MWLGAQCLAWVIERLAARQSHRSGFQSGGVEDPAVGTQPIPRAERGRPGFGQDVWPLWSSVSSSDQWESQYSRGVRGIRQNSAGQWRWLSPGGFLGPGREGHRPAAGCGRRVGTSGEQAWFSWAHMCPHLSQGGAGRASVAVPVLSLVPGHLRLCSVDTFITHT